MITEEEIIASIVETVTRLTSNQDDRINNERYLRSLLHKHRALVLQQYSMNGHMILDECFQYVGELEFEYLRPRIYKIARVPKYIAFENRYGFYFEKNGVSIPVVGSDAFMLSKNSVVASITPKITADTPGFKLFVGDVGQCGNYPPDNTLIQDFNWEIANNNNKVKAKFYAVLMNPDNALDYDFTIDPFPCPGDVLQNITQNILYREFNIILQAQADKVTDGEDKPTP